MSRLAQVITAREPEIRNQALDALCAQLPLAELMAECAALEEFRRRSENLYERVRALFFLYSIHRFQIPRREGAAAEGRIPFHGYVHLLERRFEEAIRAFLAAQQAHGPSAALSSALAAAYRGLGFQTLADQVRRSVRSTRGNQWMFRAGHPLDSPLRVRRELLSTDPATGLFPILRESTPVRMDFSHSAWSDIFFLGMDYPEGARVFNTSINLAVRGSGEPRPPVEASFRIIDEPVLRLVSVDLGASADIRTTAEIFDFARDYLGLLKAAVIASGLVPSGMEGSGLDLGGLLERLTGSRSLGIELVSRVHDIPKGSRLAVSTSLLACLITVCMRATGQVRRLTGGLEEQERRTVAARAILGEWLGGSGGGWQDSGGVWPGMKLIEGVAASPGDVEYGISRGCLLPRHRVYPLDEISSETRQKLQESLILVHGGMAQDVGPILEMVTEKYLLRLDAEWRARLEAGRILDDIIECLKRGDIRGLGACTHRNFEGPIQTIIPWAGNHYTDLLIDSVRRVFGGGFWGFWMLGGMAGGGMGFLLEPAAAARARTALGELLLETKRRLERGVPFAMDPVVYDFSINENGTMAELYAGREALMPPGYYTLRGPSLLRREARELSQGQRRELEVFAAAARTRPEWSGMAYALFERLLPAAETAASTSRQALEELLAANGFDRVQHEKIRADLRSGRIGLAQNRLPVTTAVEDVREGDVADTRKGLPPALTRIGEEALASGALAILTLAGGMGTRWTRGAGVVKALNPFVRLKGRWRNFIEIHLAKSRRALGRYGRGPAHIFTTSFMTHAPVAQWLEREANYGYSGRVVLSPGRSIGLRLIPMARDLRFAWEEMPQQMLDEQKQKVRDSARAALIQWAVSSGEGADYTDNLPEQCVHPVGHWYEVPNLFLNGVLRSLLEEQPGLQYLLLHNIDTLGAWADPALLGLHIESGAAMTCEVIGREMEDRGGGLARVDGKLRLVEGLALPEERLEFELSYYNTNTMWITIDALLGVFGLTRADLASAERTREAVRRLAARMPAYVTLKDVKKRWGKGQEDIFPVSQYEKLWGDMTALPEWRCAYVAVDRRRGQQLKEVAQLDGWLREGSAAWVEELCEF
ncbi:MAG: UTP--glucose-1-phosphate uridylyltransferase [Bryobacteraceae bacterium]|nr:MAG: UTP--glucose-1-phosphate uridylyltransferase [Bryobacteraceae bacterium]